MPARVVAKEIEGGILSRDFHFTYHGKTRIVVPWEIRFSRNPRLINLTIPAILILKNKTYSSTKNVIIIAAIVEFVSRSFAFFLY